MPSNNHLHRRNHLLWSTGLVLNHCHSNSVPLLQVLGLVELEAPVTEANRLRSRLHHNQHNCQTMQSSNRRNRHNHLLWSTGPLSSLGRNSTWPHLSGLEQVGVLVGMALELEVCQSRTLHRNPCNLQLTQNSSRCHCRSRWLCRTDPE